MSSLGKWIGGQAAAVAVKSALQFFLWPLLGTGPAIMIGWLTGQPLFHLYIGTLLTFAALVWLVIGIDKWMERNRTENKLVFLGVKGTLSTSEDGGIVAMRFGFDLRNMGNVPIGFHVDDMKTSVIPQDQKHKPCYPPNKEYEKREVVIPPTGLGWFQDHNIPLPKGLRGSAEARMECRVSYGRKGDSKHVLEIKKRAFFYLMDGGVSGGKDWYDQ